MSLHLIAKLELSLAPLSSFLVEISFNVPKTKNKIVIDTGSIYSFNNSFFFQIKNGKFYLKVRNKIMLEDAVEIEFKVE